ncbi:hypothetical protein [Moorena producens]|uniref:hypothetical protein n=1 Tax=Moorena producens TaxID=1155739 RepID=UPI003C766093
MLPIPDYLIALTVVLVVIPSVFVILLRFALHTHLLSLGKRVRRLIHGQPRGKKPRIVEELERRFSDASRHLEQVNTGALIDQAYSHEKVVGISCDQIDYIGRIMPSLLLSFGLLGTFIGITINLLALSQTISQSDATDINTLVNQLQQPLEGMGIAFTTSLTAIFFSAVLTVINVAFNTGLAKNNLISYLEDYLDNIYQPSLAGQTRLDVLVQGMSNIFESFLARFGQTVREAVESSLREKVQEIADANTQVLKLAENSYNRFFQAASTIARSAEEFQLAAAQFTQVAQTFEHSQFPQKLSKATVDLTRTQSSFSESASMLSQSVQGMGVAMAELQRHGVKLVKLAEEISALRQSSLEVVKQHHHSQQALGKIIPQLQQGAQGFQSAIARLDQLEQRIASRSDSLSDVHAELAKLVSNVKSYTEGVSLGIQALGDRLDQSITQQANTDQHNYEIMRHNLEKVVNHLNNTNQEIAKISQKLTESNQIDGSTRITQDMTVGELVRRLSSER